MEMFNKAIETDPNEYWALLGLSEVYRRKRRYRQQLEATLRAAEICEDDSDVYNHMGIALQSLREYENAERAYRHSLKLDPYNRKAANNLGFLYERFLEKTDDESFKEKAIQAWKQRLLICRDTNSSNKMATTRLRNLGVDDATIETWLKEATLEEQGGM
jgi:tetratricopeptide (TPR) repeat protein